MRSIPTHYDPQLSLYCRYGSRSECKMQNEVLCLNPYPINKRNQIIFKNLKLMTLKPFRFSAVKLTNHLVVHDWLALRYSSPSISSPSPRRWVPQRVVEMAGGYLHVLRLSS